MEADFTRKLLEWNEQINRRQMPWKGETDPYRIWLSEIILQQTRVEQGWGYYERFIRAFPTIESLAVARDEEVFKYWEGLGYYTRCRNLLHTARYILNELGGIFPGTYDQIIRLKGIGPYTAAAIASFAFNEKKAVVDGNVQRVFARYFGITTPAGTGEGRKLFLLLAGSLIDEAFPGIYNQAIMDFGATICKPRNPLCDQCPQASECEALRHGTVAQLPVKEKTLTRRTRWLYYFIIEVGDSVYIRKREGKDIWQNLHEFVLLETQEAVSDPATELLPQILRQPYKVIESSAVLSQQLTHQHIRGRFVVVRAPAGTKLPADYKLVKRSGIARYAFPKFINSYLDKIA